MLSSRFVRFGPRILRSIVSILFVLSALAVSVFAQEPPNVVAASWVAGGPALWSTPGRWSCNCTPNNGGGNTYDVTIGASGTVMLIGPDVVSTFTTAGPGALVISTASTLGVLGTSINSGAISLSPFYGKSFSATYTQTSMGTLDTNIASAALYGKVTVSGAASLAGTLNAGVVGSFVPTIGETFVILEASSLTGTFSNSTIAINATEHFDVSYTANSVVLTVAAGA
jgi:hypothetical protein